jgi:hypothetical protein
LEDEANLQLGGDDGYLHHEVTTIPQGIKALFMDVSIFPPTLKRKQLGWVLQIKEMHAPNGPLTFRAVAQGIYA